MDLDTGDFVEYSWLIIVIVKVAITIIVMVAITIIVVPLIVIITGSHFHSYLHYFHWIIISYFNYYCCYSNSNQVMEILLNLP